MSYRQPAPEGKDPHLWEIAQRRASFKKHLATYIVMNLFFWAIWYFSDFDAPQERSDFPWPIWPMLGWGIGLTFHYISAYVSHKAIDIENEYQKLIDKQKNNQI
jgi:hypothetical protein